MQTKHTFNQTQRYSFLASVTAFFLTLMLFIPRRDSERTTEDGPIVFTSILLWSEKGIWHFQLTGGNKKKNLIMFYPPKGLCKAKANWAILILSILLCYEMGIWNFQFTGGNLPKKTWKCFIYGWMNGMDGWMGWMGWMGWDGISKVFFNVLHTLLVYCTNQPEQPPWNL